jgi:4-amino-4-deoxy-L-arabinose transferase-like glycosyltransferase
MERRIFFPLGFGALGMLLGILIGRWFMPDRYGLVTMVLLVFGGLVTGALLMGAVMGVRAARGANPVRSPSSDASADSAAESLAMNVSAPAGVWQMQIGESWLRVRYDSEWWTRTRAGLRENAAPTTASLPWFSIGCLFGAVTLALYGQFAFTEPKSVGVGLYAYLFAIFCFVLLVLAVDVTAARGVLQNAVVNASDAPRPRGRGALIVLASLGGLIAAMVGATTAWNAPQTENIVLWIGAILLYAMAFVPWSRFARWLRARDMQPIRARLSALWRHRFEMLALAAIVAVACIVRYWHLAWIPGIFGGDEGEMGNEALSILNGELKNPFVTGWLSHATLFFFVQAYSLEIFGKTVYGLRVLSVIGGTLSVFITYLLIRRLFHRRLALITAALLAVYNFHIHFSRLALNNIFDAVFAPLVLLLLYVGLESRRAAYFAAAGMAMGLSIYFYHGARLIPIVVALFGVYLFLVERDTILKNVLNFVWMGLGALIVAGPLLYFFSLHPADFMARLTQRGIFQSGWFDTQIKNGRAASEVLLDQVRRSFLAFNAFPDPTNWFGTGLPLLDPLSAMFLVFGSVYGAMRWRQKNLALMLIWLVSGIFFGSTLLENPPTSPSFVIVTVPAIFFVALGLEKLLELAGRVLKPLARVRGQVAALFVLLFAAWNLGFYFIEYTPRYSYGGEPNWVAGALVNYLEKRHDKYRVYFVAPPYIYLGIGSRKFMMPNLNGEDVLDPIRSADDLAFVRPARPALFVFVPARAQEFPIVQQEYPNGIVRHFNKPDGSPLFFIYEVNTP